MKEKVIVMTKKTCPICNRDLVLGTPVNQIQMKYCPDCGNESDKNIETLVFKNYAYETSSKIVKNLVIVVLLVVVENVLFHKQLSIFDTLMIIPIILVINFFLYGIVHIMNKRCPICHNPSVRKKSNYCFNCGYKFKQ